jgi:hypothetical protein
MSLGEKCRGGFPIYDVAARVLVGFGTIAKVANGVGPFSE